MGRVHVIVTSPRVAPGLLSAEAWALLTGSARVAAPDLTDPVATAVRRAGVEVTELAGPTVLTSGGDRVAPDDAAAEAKADGDAESRHDADSHRDAGADLDSDAESRRDADDH